MPVPNRIYATRRLRPLAGLALLLFLTAAPLFARGPEPSFRIPLPSLGFEPQTPQFLLAGGSMLTLHYVDNHHLLLTFGVHRLMERIADDPPDDEDRVVEAVLLEAPSGRVLARTDWRLHDNGQYLWDLGHGRFLLRVHDTLTIFAPMANLASGQPFQQQPFLTTKRRIGAVLLSPEADLLIVESVERTPPQPPQATPLFGPAPKPTPDPLGEPGDPAPVALSLYRLSMPREGGEEIRATLAGLARSTSFGALAATGAGHMAVVDQGDQLHWAFDFHPYHGDVKELSAFDSSCRPTPQFVSNSEFVSFGCHGGNNPHVLGGFNMRGEEMWEQNLFGDFVASSFVFAPLSGRFALSRIVGNMPFDDLTIVPTETFTAQNVVVYQTESGKQILRVDCSPIARAGQNFTLAPDGMSLAVIREDAIEIYSLPSLSAKDQADVKQARALVPEENTLPIEFDGPAVPATSAQAVSPSSGAQSRAITSSTPTSAPNVSAAANVPAAAPRSTADQPAASSTPDGDAVPDQPRKRPTLYTLPTDPADKQPK